jgi:hypothetical protein
MNFGNIKINIKDVTYIDGHILHTLNGKRHRDGDLPAVEWVNGDKSWYIHGKLHRENGPAVEFVNGDKWYYLDNQRYATEQSYRKAMKEMNSVNRIIANYVKSI